MFTAPKIVSLVAFAAVAIAAVPASARINQDGASRVRLTAEQRNGQTVYCGKQQVSGSLIPAKTCLSKDEVAQLGGRVGAPRNALASN